MRILITESQYRVILNEDTVGLDEFISKTIDKFPKLADYENTIRDFILDSKCSKIEIAKNSFMAFGLALHDKVVFNPNIFNFDMGYFLYIVFHEMAHQYQYKKYGAKHVYDLYNGELDIDNAVKLLKYIENVADQFSMRKCRELFKKGLDIKLRKTGSYDNVSDIEFKSQLVKIRNLIRNKDIEDPEKISETYYNYILNIK